MRRIHRIGVELSQSVRKRLSLSGFDMNRISMVPGLGSLATFEISEDDPAWSSVSGLIESWDVSNVVTVEFTVDEIASARAFQVGCWHHGYPGPDSDKCDYLDATYAGSEFCRKCGIGKRQTGPFVMSREPRWGKHSFLQLIWIYDELFVKPDVWKLVFDPLGVRCREVLGPDRRRLDTVIQLDVSGCVALAGSHHAGSVCEMCGQCKFDPRINDWFPRLNGRLDGPIVKTREWFGDGGQANQMLIVAGELGRRMLLMDRGGVWLHPCAE